MVADQQYKMYPIADAQAINCTPYVRIKIKTEFGSDDNAAHLHTLSMRQDIQHDKRACNPRHCTELLEVYGFQLKSGKAPGRQQGAEDEGESKRMV
jgi:hypothetical protein